MKPSNKTCRVCNVELVAENWSVSRRNRRDYICKGCHVGSNRAWRQANPDKKKAQSERGNRKQGMRAFNENKECTQYLGIHVAERVLSQVFKDVLVMPMHNPGYDVICNHGKRIDIKSSCQRENGSWAFHIERNTIADFFLCIAFDNREDLTPLHAWLISGNKLNHLVGASIRPGTIHKWDKYRLDMSKICACCDAMRVNA